MNPRSEPDETAVEAVSEEPIAEKGTGVPIGENDRKAEENASPRASSAASVARSSSNSAKRTTSSGSGEQKSANRRPTPRRTAPKPASRAASLVASSTLAGRSSVTDDVLRKWSMNDGDAVSHNASESDDVTISDKGQAPAGSEVTGAVALEADATEAKAFGGDVTKAVELEDELNALTADPAGDLDEDGLVLDIPVSESRNAETDDRLAVAAVEVAAVGVAAVEGTAVDEAEVDHLDEDRDSDVPAVTVDRGQAADRGRAADLGVTEHRAPAVDRHLGDVVLAVEGLSKSFEGSVAVADVELHVRAGSIFGIVGPNGAGKTTTLSMVTGLLRPDRGTVHVHGADVWKNPSVAKRNMGVLPDRLRLFDRLTGAQLLFYAGSLRGLDRATVKARSADLAAAFGLEDAVSRLVTDYSAGMTKKIALASAMIHSPRVLILDEPFEAVDPVSAANVIEILQKYAAAGGTVVMSSHSMDMIQRICDSVSIIVHGRVLASGTMDEVRAGGTLEDRFVDLAGGRKAAEGMEWLHSFSG